MPDENRKFILYDGRACADQGTEDASVLVACEDEAEAKNYKGEFGAMACYSYRLDGTMLVNEQWEWDWFPPEEDMTEPPTRHKSKRKRKRKNRGRKHD